MKLVSFFVLSLAVHAGALIYPVLFHRQSTVELVQVTILPIEQELFGRSDHIGSGDPAPRAGSKPVTRTPTNLPPALQSNPQNTSEPKLISDKAPTTVSISEIALGSPPPKYDESHEAGTSGSTSKGMQDAGIAVGSGNGTGLTGTGFGTGNGSGASESKIFITQARIGKMTRPTYPESARREGREGRVLLRVLVDDQGRSKQVEINSSSGSAALDRAAAEAIQRWRFHPAHYGDQPVESWLRIPIEFRLTEVKSW